MERLTRSVESIIRLQIFLEESRRESSLVMKLPEAVDRLEERENFNWRSRENMLRFGFTNRF